MGVRRQKRIARERHLRALRQAEDLGAILANGVEEIGARATKRYNHKARTAVQKLAIADLPTPNIDGIDLFDETVWDETLEEAETFLGAVVVEEMGSVGLVVRMNQPLVRELLAAHLGAIDLYGDDMRDHIKTVLDEGLQKGWSIDKTKKALTGGPVRPRAAELIARTEMIAASNGASFTGSLAVAEPGDTKVWLPTPDGKTRDSHRNVKEVPMDQPFIVGGEEAMHPGATTLSTEERAH